MGVSVSLERILDGELHDAGRGSVVGRGALDAGREASEAGAVESRGGRSEHHAVGKIESLRAESHCAALAKLEVPRERQVEIHYGRTGDGQRTSGGVDSGGG